MEKIKVSIITTTSNSEGTIARTVESVLVQNYSPLEYIIVDNQSSDNTISIIETCRSKFRNGLSLQLISEPDRGIYDGMNKGLKNAGGELIGIINSDDWYEPNAVRNVVDAHAVNPEAVIYGMLKLYKNDKLYQIRQNMHTFIRENMCQHPTWFVPKKIYQQYGLFDDSYQIGGDYEFANRLLSQGVSFTRLEKVLANFTMGGASSRSPIGGQEWLDIKLKYGHISKEEYDKATPGFVDSTNARYHFKMFIKKLLQFQI